MEERSSGMIQTRTAYSSPLCRAILPRRICPQRCRSSLGR